MHNHREMAVCRTCRGYAAAMGALMVVLVALTILSALYPNVTFP